MNAAESRVMSDGGFPRSVTIYGTGLMGTSLALALKQRIPGIQVFGIDEPGVLSRAQKLRAFDDGQTAAADLVVLAAPVGAILQLLDKLKAHPPPLLLDLGSTKLEICRKAGALQLPFLGGHPMTGSERSGPEAASANLFRNTPFFLCPVASTPPDATKKISGIVEAIEAHPTIIEADKHDALVARLSHLPQILSTLLAEQTGEHRAFAGPGWNSVTRLGASPFRLWRDIFETSGSLPDELQSYIERLQSILEALKAGNLSEIEAVFERANRAVSGESHE